MNSAKSPSDKTGTPHAPSSLGAWSGRWVAAARRGWDLPVSRAWRARVKAWRAYSYSGGVTVVALGALLSLLIAVLNAVLTPLPNPGVVYLPLIAMVAYYWDWRYGAIASVLQLVCVFVFFMPSGSLSAAQRARNIEQLVTLTLVDLFILALVQLARSRRDRAEREARRFAALNEIGLALASELDERRLLRLIAQTARDLTGAGFAAFTLRPLDPLGAPLVPAEGSRFALAAVVGVTAEQEEQFQRAPLGGEGLLAPIFRFGVSVRVADALAQSHVEGTPPAPDARRAPISARRAARAQAAAYANGEIPAAALHTMGVPRGHPIVRSFLGAPLLDHEGRVRGGLLLGHAEPGRFTAEDEAVLKALAAQAAVALENARLYHAAQTQARELDAVFESISEGVSVVDTDGAPRHENRAAAAIRASDAAGPLVDDAVQQALRGTPVSNVAVTMPERDGERRSYLVSAAPLVGKPGASPSRSSSPAIGAPPGQADGGVPAGAVVVWHDVTETERLLAERQAHAQAEAQRTLLQMVIDELPTGVYLARGRNARLALANRAAHDVWGAQWPVGKSMAEFLATSGVRIVGVNGQTLATDELATVRVLQSGSAVRHHQEVIHRPNGAALPILFNAVTLDPRLLDALTLTTPATDSEPAPAASEPAALVVLQDMTALKEAERLKDEFITIAAHELKTPMAAVKGYAGMLLRQSERDEQARLAPWQTEALETIDQATSRLVELTNDLLDVTRIQAGRVDLRLEPHDLGALVRRVTKRFAATTDRHTLTVRVAGDAGDAVTGDDGDAFVVACLDVARTEQVVGNLLSNAIKYSPDGGAITLTVRQDAAGMAELTVRDAGIGIPQAEQAALFQRFSRAENARQLGIAGTGLGLYLCSELVRLQGGSIWFTSAEGQGTTFHVMLPLATE